MDKTTPLVPAPRPRRPVEFTLKNVGGPVRTNNPEKRGEHNFSCPHCEAVLIEGVIQSAIGDFGLMECYQCGLMSKGELAQSQADDLNTRATYTDSDGNGWSVRTDGHYGAGATRSDGSQPVTHCTLVFEFGERRRFTKYAPMAWNSPELLAELFETSKEATEVP